ncbi:hypothetical protein N9K26_01655 [Flavobacteriales bacterium]|jgi:hypothetical protein|nr:hypothetical protein [Flavobacteriales bacterium]|tara:strand:- start:872 stop:1312 length:441 start_codon:yes stop_codon:yes gene_type:complete
MKAKIIALTFLTLVLVYGCKKEEKYDIVPEIEFVSLTPSSSPEFSQNVILTIKYKDGDGDIGTEDPDIYSLYVKDSRLPQADEYHIQPLSPPESTIQIEGELNIKLAGLFVLGSNTSEKASFKVILKDRAGNFSNEITTSNITITK